MLVAWIGVVGAVIAAAIGAYATLQQNKLAVEVHKRTTMFDRELNAEDVLTKYREPLAAAAYDLQRRFYNILRMDFINLWCGNHPRAEDAVRTTLFRLAQYFGWSEILRRDIQFLSFPTEEATRRVADLQSAIANRFLTHERGVGLMLWADEQRAIGERMIVEEHGKVLCMGYARFRDQCDTTFADLCQRLRDELEEESTHARMRDIQHLLCDLVKALDPECLRYARDMELA